LQYVNWKERKPVAAGLRQIYPATTAEAAEQHLAEFEQRWEAKYSTMGKIWRRHWAGVVSLFAFPQEIRKAIYTTNANAVESLHMSRRKVIKTRASSREEATLKILYLALKNVVQKWKPSPNWRTTLNHLMLL
jgi:putative transposase